MKPQEFLKENEFIGDDAHNMHQSHQHHMLREECYHSAANAIKLHKLLGELPDGHDLDAWAAEKISIANDYLKTVTEWLEYDVIGGTNEAMMAGGMEAFSMESAERQYAELLGEDQGVAEGFLNEASSDEAWELVGQPVPEIQQFVKQMGYGNDEQSVAKITPIIDGTPATQIPAASIPKLKNLANKGNDAQTLKAIQQISGRPDAAQQYTRLMQARDAGEGRNRDVSGYLQYVKSGNYDPPVLLKLPTGVYVIGGRTRLYAALALGIPANVKIISANNFQQGVAEARNTNPRVNEIRQLAKDFFGGNPYSSGTIGGGTVLRLSFHIGGNLDGDYRYVPAAQISPKDQQTLKSIKSKFEKFMASKGVIASEVSLKFHIGSGVYAGVRIAIPQEQGVAEGQEQTPDQVRQTLNAWMNKDQQFKDPTQRAGFQAKVWPYIQTNINSILSDKGKDGKGGYPAAPYAAWLLVQHMDAYPQNQVKFLQQLGQSGLNPDGKLQFLQDRAAVNQWIAANANNEEYYVNGKPLPNPTVNVRNPAIFKDAGIVANSREEALQNAIDAGNKLLVAAVQATNAQTQPSYKQGVAENTLDQDLDQIAESFESTLSETMSSGVSSIPAVGGGTLFGGSYQNPDNPFKQKKKSVKKSSVIKR